MSGWRTSSLLPQRSMMVFAFIAFGLVAIAFKIVATQEELVPGASSPVHAASFVRPQHISIDALEYAEPPLFELAARDGSTLAHSVRGYALEASPYHLWLVHTPARIVAGLADVLGELTPDDLDRALLRTDEFGWRSVDTLPLTRAEADAISAWIAAGGPRAFDDVGPLPGLIVEAYTPAEGEALESPRYQLRWSPRLLLSEHTRARLDADPLDDDRISAATWARALSRKLWELLEGPRDRALAAWSSANDTPPPGWQLVPPKTGLAKLLDGIVEPKPTWRVSATVPQWQLAESRSEWVFAHLVGCRYTELVEHLPVELVPRVRAFLADEHVGAFQMWLRPTARRSYPATRLGVLGRVGWIDGDFERRHGLWGLEYAAEVALLGEGLPASGTHDRFDRDAFVRSRKKNQEYYRDHGAGDDPPRAVATIDPAIQARMGDALARLEAEHDTSLTMGIVIDLDTRDVLALDWRDPYEFGLIAPFQHSFTPGSTFKLVTMALALEHTSVRPGTTFDVGYGHYRVPGTSRVVGEAEGFATGTISAAMCLAKSSNAGMVQIGHEVPVPVWKQETTRLGYGLAADAPLLPNAWYNPSGIIGERASANDKNVWSKTRSHTSVAFGDSMSTTMVQHVTALCALVHDGELRPLRWLDRLEDGGVVVELEPSVGPRVVSERTVADLRSMMRLGAREGTGRRLARPDGLVLETKTGTYEKLVKGDVSYHAMGADLARARERAREEGEEPAWDSNDAHRRLRGQWVGAKQGYTSSIVVVGHLESDPTRRVLAYVVAEDPRGEARFGSDVTGITAVELVAYALGVDDAEERRRSLVADGRAPRLEAFAVPAVEDLSERPWEEVGR